MTFAQIMSQRQMYIGFRAAWQRQTNHLIRYVGLDFHVDEDWTTTIMTEDRRLHRRQAMIERTARWRVLRGDNVPKP